MAINLKRITDKAREKVGNEKKDEESKSLLAQGQGPRVSQQEAELAWQRQKAEKATQANERAKTGQSPFRTREEALQALKKQKEQKQIKTTATPAVASAVKPAAATDGVKPTQIPVGAVTGMDTKAVTDWYTQNSEKTKEKAWKEQRSWEDQRSRIQPVMDAFAARDAGQALTPEQQVTIDNYDYEEIKAGWDETNAEISRLQKITGVESAMAQGYGSIKDERAERYKGVVSDVEANAAQMIGSGRMGEWSQMWQQEMDTATAKRDKLAADLDILKSSGADKDVIAEQEERLGWLNEDVQALTDVSVLAQPDFAQKSQTMEGVDDIVYQMVSGIAPPAWALQQGTGGYDAMADLWSRIQKMSDEERSIYKYIYASDPENGRQNAQDYLGRISNRLMYRNVQQREDEMAELANALPVTTTIASAMYTPMETAAGIGVGLAKLMGNEVNPYNPGFNAVRDKATIRETVQEKIGNPLGQFAYGVGTSIADVGVASMLGGGAGGIPGISTAMMALPAGASKSMEMLEKGADPGTALLGGAAAAGAEWATEKLGFDRLYGSFTSGKMAGTYKDMLQTAVTGFFAEGSEEAASEGVNEIIDRWLMGDNSQRVQQIRRGVENGLSVDDAIREADWAFVKTLGENFLAGGVSGGLMQGGSYAAGMANANAATQQIVEELPEVNRDLVQAAMEMEAGVRTMDEAVVEEAYAQIEAEQEKKVEQQNHAVFEAPAEVNGVQGAVSGVQKSGEGATVLVRQDGKETAVPLSEVQFQNEEQRQAYGFATAYADEATARQFLAGYEKSNAPIRNYAKGFAAVYAAGRNSRQLIGTEKVWAKAVPEMVQQLAYEAGQKAAAQEDARLDMDADVDAAIARNVQAMPRMATEEYTGAVNQVRRSKITKSQATQMALLNNLGKKYGTQYIFVDSFQETQAANQHLGAAAASVQNGMINGVYKAGTNQMVIALDAEGGNLLRAAGHESWHYIKEHSQKNDYVRGDADALQAFVLDKLQGVEGYDLETRIAQKQDQYKRMAGQELDRDAAVEEIVADSLVEVLATEQNVRDLMEQHATLGEKVMGFIKRFLGDIRATLRKLGGKNAEARAMLEQDEKTLQQIADHFDRVMIEVQAVRESGTIETVQNGQVRLSQQNIWYDYSKSFADQVDDWINGQFPQRDTLVLGRTPEIFRQVGLSDIPFTMDQTHLDYAINGTKNADHHMPISLVKQLPQLLEQPVAIIESQTQTKNSVMALVDAVVNRKPMMAAVRIDSNGRINGEIIDSNHMVSVQGRGNAISKLLYDAVQKENSGQTAVYYLDKKRGVSILKQAGLQLSGVLNRGGLIHSIHDAKSPVNVKYLDATETLQFKRWFNKSQVVNEDGSPKVMYHGTATEFWAFDKRKANDLTGRRLGLGAGKSKFYLTEYRGSADAAAYSAQGRGNGKNPKVMELYVSAQKVMDRVEYDRLLQEEYKKHPNSEPHQAGYDYRARDKAIAAVDRAIRKDGYDGVWDRDSGEMFVYEATQIKSATDNIGLFDGKNPDIRYSVSDFDIEPAPVQSAAFKRWFGDSEVVNEDGSPLIVYHATSNDFTAFDKERLGEITDDNASDNWIKATAHVGFWFNTQPLGKKAGGTKNMPVYLSAQRLYEIGSVEALTNEIWDTYDRYGFEFDHAEPTLEEAKDAAEVFLNDLQGYYDGIIVLRDEEFGGASYVVFEPTQIKSATDNVGTFDAGNPDIRYSISAEDIDPAPEQPAAFKRWFGESVVTDDAGEPLVVYHGSPYWNKINVFKRGKRGYLGPGIYLTNDKQNAQHYADKDGGGGTVYELYAKIENPLYVTNLHDPAEEIINAAYGKRGKAMLEKRVSANTNANYWISSKDIQKLMEAGYDGIVWGNERRAEREYVVFRPEQIKSATDNVGTYDPNNPDIRFSLRDVDVFNPEMEMLLEENRALRDTVRALNQQLKGENGQLDEKTVRRVASGLKKKYASTVPLNTLTENLTRAFNAMRSAENTRQSEAAMEMMGNIALDMVQKSQIADREAYDASRGLRERFRKSRIGLTDTQWQEAENLYDTARDFRRAVFGKWNVPAQNGRGVTTLDMIWDDLVAEYPQYFDADASEGDMVQQVLAMLDATAIKYENPFGAEIEQVASGVAAEIYREYLDAGSETGGKNAAVDKLMDQLADARKTILEQKRGLRKANRDIADMRAKREAQALRRKQNQDYTQVKNEIIRKKGQMLKKLEAPKSGAFIPQSMHDAVHELLKAIDFEGKLGGETNKPLTREMLDRARDEYAKLNLPDENGGTGPMAAFYNGDLVHDFNLLAVEADGLRAKELSMKHMQSLRNIVAGYAAAIINEDRMFMQNRRESLQETGDDLLASMSTRREHTVQGPVREWFSKGLQQGLIKPVTAFHQFKGTAMEPVWKALRNAEGQHIRHVEEAADYLEEALGKYDQHKSIREEGTKGKRDKAKEITFDNGTKMKLTDQELMTLYATAKREQMVGTQHLVKGGFTLANAPKGSSLRPVILTARDIQTITNSLTRQQREYVDHMVGYLSGTCADWGNEVTMELYGVEKFHEEYYIPFSVNKNYVKVEPATEQDSRIKTGSFTKALTANASNPLEIKPFTEIWCQHVEKMSDYNAFVLPIEDMTRLMNYKGEGDGVKATMNRAYGKQTTDYIMHFLRRLNGNSRNEMGENWLGGFMGRAKGAAVTFNLSVAIQQAGSAPRAMAMIAPRHFMSGLAKAFAHGKVDNHRAIGAAYAELEKYAPIAVEKGWGYFDTNMSRGMYQRAQNTTMDRINDAGGKAAEWGDKITWAIIWEAVKNETADTYKEVMVGSEEYYQLCADRFQDVIDHTQVLDSIFQRAEFAAERGGMKKFMAFMSEPLTTYNMLYRAGWDIAQAKGKDKARAWGRFGRTFGAFALSSALTAALKSFVMALRDRDNEKKDEEGNIIGVRDYWDKYLESLPGAVLDNLLGVGTVFTNAISDALSGFGGGSDLTTGWIGNLGTGCKQMFDMLTGNRDSTLENWEKAMYKMLQGSSSVIGVGFGNLWRDVKSIGLTAYEIVEQDMLAGAAWDQERPFDERLKAAQKNYVYKKQPGDLMHKQNTGIYYDLMLTAYFEDGGMYENYEAAADAAIATGATYKGLTTAFKTRLRAAEDRIPQAAQALVEGDMDSYNEYVEELQGAGIGLRAISSMVLAEVKELLPQEEASPGAGADVIGEMQRTDVDEDPAKYMMNQAYNEAQTPQELKAAIDTLRESGTTDKDLRTKVTTTYRKAYCNAIWNGDTQAAKEAAAMLKGAGVGITDDDLSDWTSGDYAKNTLYDLIRAGDGKQAVKVRAAMYKAKGQTEVNKTIGNWVSRYVKGSEDEAAARKALLALGYSQQTIDGWFAK